MAEISRVTERFVNVGERLGAYWMGESNLSTFNERHIQCVQYIFDKYLNMLSGDDRRQAEIQRAICLEGSGRRPGVYKKRLGCSQPLPDRAIFR